MFLAANKQSLLYLTVRNILLKFVCNLLFQELLEAASDVMSDWLDKLHGAEVTDNKIFDDLPQLYEDKFHQDMAALNVCCLAVLLFMLNMCIVLLSFAVFSRVLRVCFCIFVFVFVYLCNCCKKVEIHIANLMLTICNIHV